MERYEQLVFDITPKLVHKYTSEEICFDNEGHEINVGDYVVAVCGEARKAGIEGFVKEILFYEESGPEIKITTYGGRILKDCEDPRYYVVKI